MSAASHTPGGRLAVLRKDRGLSQVQLARQAAISLSLLTKVETGRRPLTLAVAGVVARAMDLPVAVLFGEAPAAATDEHLTAELRAALRDYDLPRPGSVTEAQVSAALAATGQRRSAADLAGVLRLLPGLIRDATAHALTANTAVAWTMLAEGYSTAYWLAARHRWQDLAELAVTRQAWAAAQKPSPLARAIAARDRAGVYLNGGDPEGGLIIVDAALADAQAHLRGADLALATGVLNLRGLTLAGRLTDKRTGRAEAERHLRSARTMGGQVPHDVTRHNMNFGPGNTLTHELATRLDLGEPGKAIELARNLPGMLAGLPAVRIAPCHLNLTRAYLDVGDRDSALANLIQAWEAAPQLAAVHPWGQECLRILISLHRRSNPQLARLSRLAGQGGAGAGRPEPGPRRP